MAVKAAPVCKKIWLWLWSVSQTLMLNRSWFSSTVQPESKPEVSVQKDVKSHTSPPVSVCPVSTAKPPRTNTTNATSSPTNTSAAPAASVQVRRKAGMEWGTWGVSLRCAEVAPGSFQCSLPQLCFQHSFFVFLGPCGKAWCGYSGL